MAKVSVIVPTYNRSAYLKESLKSILKQEYVDFEVIVSDNASTDDTEFMVKSFNDDRIVYHKNPENIGSCNNYNRALQISKGEYIQFFSDDDIMRDGCLQKNAAALDKFTSAGLVHSNITILDSEGKISPEKHWGEKVWRKWNTVHNESKLFPKEKYQFYLYNIYNIICMQTVMIRRDVVNKIGYFDPAMQFIADWDYWLKISLFYDIYYINEVLVLYRMHGGSETNRANLFLKKELKYMKKNIQKQYADKLLVKHNTILDWCQEDYFYAHYNYFHLLKFILKQFLPFKISLK